MAVEGTTQCPYSAPGSGPTKRNTVPKKQPYSAPKLFRDHGKCRHYSALKRSTQCLRSWPFVWHYSAMDQKALCSTANQMPGTAPAHRTNRVFPDSAVEDVRPSVTPGKGLKGRRKIGGQCCTPDRVLYASSSTWYCSYTAERRQRIWAYCTYFGFRSAFLTETNRQISSFLISVSNFPKIFFAH